MRHKHGITGFITVNDPGTFILGDVDPAVAQWILGLAASPTLNMVLNNDAYSALSCAYLVLEKDRTLLKA
jgi:hypothetical protein